MIFELMEENKNYSEEYRDSLRFTDLHYENFPVVSFLVPRNLRKHIALIYRFARQADDIADEGVMPEKGRLGLLYRYEEELSRSLAGNPSGKFWAALADTIESKNISHIHFYNLLKAFRLDVAKNRYSSFQDLLNYCSNSANPVGRIILELYGIREKEVFEYSDYICTALQLTNFWQDVSVDLLKGRIYVPQDELTRFQVSEADFDLRENNANFKALMQFQADRTMEMFRRGREILRFLPFPLNKEISWTISGGELILKKIEKINYDVLNIRPVLSKSDYAFLAFRALIGR